MIETRHLKNVVIFIQTILSFVLSRKIILNIVEKILKFNEKNQQKRQGIKILTPDQMLNRLPIALANYNQETILTSLKMK